MDLDQGGLKVSVRVGTPSFEKSEFPSWDGRGPPSCSVLRPDDPRNRDILSVVEVTVGSPDPRWRGVFRRISLGFDSRLSTWVENLTVSHPTFPTSTYVSQRRVENVCVWVRVDYVKSTDLLLPFKLFESDRRRSSVGSDTRRSGEGRFRPTPGLERDRNLLASRMKTDTEDLSKTGTPEIRPKGITRSLNNSLRRVEGKRWKSKSKRISK